MCPYVDDIFTDEQIARAPSDQRDHRIFDDGTGPGGGPVTGTGSGNLCPNRQHVQEIDYETDMD